MRIGFSIGVLTEGKLATIDLEKNILKLLTVNRLIGSVNSTLCELHDANHEIFVFISAPDELDIKGKTKAKRIIERKLAECNLSFCKVAIICKSEMVAAVQRNHIDIFVDIDSENIRRVNEFTDGIDYSSINSSSELLCLINEKIEYNRKPILNNDVDIEGIPSVEQLWKKEYRIGDFKWNNEQMSPYDRMLSSNVDWLDEQAMEFFGVKFTFEQFFAEVDKLAESLQRRGIGKGYKVPCLFVNAPESFFMIYALFKVKATIAPIFPLEKSDKLKEKIEEINLYNKLNGYECNYLFISDFVYGKNKLAIPVDEKVVVLQVDYSMPIVVKIGYKMFIKPKFKVENVKYDANVISYSEFLNADRNELSVSEEDYRKYVATIKQGYDDTYTSVQLYTGGSIRSKGVNLSEKNIDSATKQFFNDRFDFRRGDKIAAFMPLNHSFGLIIGTHVALSLGVNLDIIMKIDFKNIHNLFLKDRINIMGGIPNMFPSIINNKRLRKAKDLSNAKYILSGGAAPDESIKKDIIALFSNAKAHLEFHDGYGQTEAAGGIIYDGIPNMNTNVKIVVSGSTNELGYDQIGELCLSGPQIMQGYTEKNLTPNVLKKHKDGLIWLHTGDFANISTDGRVHYVDRFDRMIKVNGEQVFLNHIEEEINTLPFVEKCAVVRKKDDIRGTVPMAFIKLNPDIKFCEDIERQLFDFYKSKFNSSTIPRDTRFVDDIPVTTVGKVDFISLEKLIIT